MHQFYRSDSDKERLVDLTDCENGGEGAETHEISGVNVSHLADNTFCDVNERDVFESQVSKLC